MCYNTFGKICRALYMVKRSNIFSAFLMFVFIVGTMFFFSCLIETEKVAYADEPYLSEPEITAEYFTGVNGKDAVYERVAYDDDRGYARNVSVDVLVNAPYYKIEYVTAEGDERRFDFVLETPASGDVSFKPTASGTYTVTISAYSDFSATELLAQKTAWFRCDLDAPVLPDSITDGLTKWVRTGTDNSFTVDWSEATDARSGLYGVYYYYAYEDDRVSEIYSLDARTAPLGKNTFTVTEKCRFVAIFYDNAGNGIATEAILDRFDDTAPYVPTYTITPTVQNGKYAKFYEIQVTFPGDSGGSGLSSSQYYRINGKTEAFAAEPPLPETIRLTKQADYTVELFSLDNAGNRSAYATINVPFNAFDVTPPDIGQFNLDFDLTDEEGICRLSVIVSDRGESGVQSVRIDETDIVLKPGLLNPTEYAAKFDCFGFENALRITATDVSGNVNTYDVPFPHFKNAAISTALQKLTTSLREMNREEYTTEYAAQIDASAERLATLLERETTTEQEIVSAASALNTAFATGEEIVLFDYVIASTPEYASASITLQAGEGLTGFLKGTVLTVTLSKESDIKKDFAKESGFGSSFTDYFGLRITEDGQERAIGEGSILVGMNMPIGYYERKIALFDADTGEQVETEVKNNKIYFGIRRSSRYALVIEGGKASKTSGGTTTATITVFGNTMKKSTFYMILGITGGVAVLAIALFVVIAKMRR